MIFPPFRDMEFQYEYENVISFPLLVKKGAGEDLSHTALKPRPPTPWIYLLRSP